MHLSYCMKAQKQTKPFPDSNETPKKTKNYMMRKWIHVCFRGVAHCFQGIGICAASQPESTTPPLRLSRRSYPVNPSEPKDLKVLSQSLQAE